MLLDSDENPREIKLPATSGELMIQEFGHVITPVDELRRTGRVSALLADEELVAGKVYLLLPVNRVNSKASEFEMALAEKQSGHTKRTRGNNMAKVSPSVCPSYYRHFAMIVVIIVQLLQLLVRFKTSSRQPDPSHNSQDISTRFQDGEQWGNAYPAKN
ncbi:hypothetical protein D0Y65_052191 [Glycine soja]|uniref:Uncharacterized protein n=1 Tax=Glycine soja TaxID=3848 RepID=A0A445FJP3_GLYSO|nr:hypothetical protein D0Y65_052191 [Glycine soja]